MAREWTTATVLETGWGFQRSCVLVAAAELDVFGAIGGDRVTVEEVADRIDGDPRGTAILLDALAALELLEKADGRYAVPAILRALLVEDSAGSVLAMVRHQATCLRRWSQLARTVRVGRPPERVAGILGPDGEREAFIEAMDNISRVTAPPLVAELVPLEFEHVLDVGGGSGTWTIAWLRANPDARATLFDLPPVLPQAEERLGREGLLDRVTLAAGDFDVDPLPAGADLVWLSAIVHQNSREQNRGLFRKIRDALRPGGRMLLRDFVMEEDRVHPPGGALFAVNMLAGTPGGGTFTLGELREDLEAAGLGEVEQIKRDEGMLSVVSARRAAETG